MKNLIILCGGSGTRLWPLSREINPKQFLNLVDENMSMFQLTYKRGLSFKPDRVICICNSLHSTLLNKQLEQVKDNKIEHIIVEEPFAKNTCAAISIATILSNMDDILLVISSDHIWDENKFNDMIETGLKLCENEIVFFGIKPTFPETGYGYIKYDNNNNVIEFVEKPNIEIAKKYINSGNYLWNSGNFMFKQQVMTNELKKHSINIYDNVLITLHNSTNNNNVIILNKEYFNEVISESIDYSIMEKYKKGKVVIYNGKWSDIGSFKSLYDFYYEKNPDKNIINLGQNCNNHVFIDSENILLVNNNNDKVITTLGLDNIIIINTNDSLLVANKDKCQDVKKIIKHLSINNNKLLITDKICYRPWGYYEIIEGSDDSGYKVKRIIIYPNKRLSLQSHNFRSEHWVIISGEANVQIGKLFFKGTKNSYFYIPTNEIHRIENIGTENIVLIETQVGTYLGEDDIIRYDDDYGRI